MKQMTAKEAAAHAGCSVSTLKRHYCMACGQDWLRMLMYGCPEGEPKCDPLNKPYFPWKSKRAW